MPVSVNKGARPKYEVENAVFELNACQKKNSLSENFLEINSISDKYNPVVEPNSSQKSNSSSKILPKVIHGSHNEYNPVLESKACQKQNSSSDIFYHRSEPNSLQKSNSSSKVLPKIIHGSGNEYNPVFEPNTIQKKNSSNKIFQHRSGNEYNPVFQPNAWQKKNSSSKNVPMIKYESDNEYTPILQPNSLQKNNYFRKNVSDVNHRNTDKYKDSALDFCRSKDDYEDSTADFFKPVFHVQHKNRKDNMEKLKMKEKMLSSVKQYKNSQTSFSRVYKEWLPVRETTLRKLQSLLKEAHDEEKNYNETQVSLKEFSYTSRCVKSEVNNQTIDFLATLAAFIGDAVSGVASVAQAVTVDSKHTKFQEIMDCDAEITKTLYAARSQCVVRYQGIEEVMRSVQCNTLSSTVCTVSGTLQIDKHWAAMENAYQKGDMTQLLGAVSSFFDDTCQPGVLGDVGESIGRYVSDNPAALDACKSAGKAICGVLNLGEKKGGENKTLGHINFATNLGLMVQDRLEIDRFKSIVEDDTYQSNLESKIQDAIQSLESEMEEMKKIYFRI